MNKSTKAAELQKPKKQKHDSFFRKIMSNKEHAQDFVNEYLPKKIQDSVDVTKLTIVPESFVEKHLKKAISDIIFRIPSKDQTKDDVFCYFLAEHVRHEVAHIKSVNSG